MKPDPEALKSLLAATLATRPEEIDCEQWLAQAGTYAELLSAGEPIPEELELVAQHISVCAECNEELEALLALLER